MVIEHPFDNSFVRRIRFSTWRDQSNSLTAQAFVLTRSTTHYRTDDRGMTWRSFDVPIAAALVARPLSFHSDPRKFGYILYQGTICENKGWGAICHDEVSTTPWILNSASIAG